MTCGSSNHPHSSAKMPTSWYASPTTASSSSMLASLGALVLAHSIVRLRPSPDSLACASAFVRDSERSPHLRCFFRCVLNRIPHAGESLATTFFRLLHGVALRDACSAAIAGAGCLLAEAMGRGHLHVRYRLSVLQAPTPIDTVRNNESSSSPFGICIKRYKIYSNTNRSDIRKHLPVG